MLNNLEKYTDNIVELFPNGKQFRIIVDATVGKFKILCKRYTDLQDLIEAFSTIDQSAFFSRQYGYNRSQTISVVNKFGYFSFGLIFEILKYFKTLYGDLHSIAISQNTRLFIEEQLLPLKQYVKNINTDAFELANVSDDFGRNNELVRNGKNQYEFREYQSTAIEALIFNGLGRGLIELPTGAGKSFVIGNFIWNLHKNFNRNFKYLIFVPNKQLVEQFYKDLLDYGYDKHFLTKFTAGLKKHEQFNPSANIIIANRQYVFANKEKLPKIDVLICDEVHQIAPNSSSYEYVERSEAIVKIGCSGTIPREKYHRWMLLGIFSKIVYTEDIVSLQEKGYISKLKITLLKITDKNIEQDKNCLFNLHTERKYRADDPTCDIKFDDAFNAEIDYINKFYKDLYSPILEHVKGLNGNTLILFDRIEFGTNMFDLAKQTIEDKQIYYIDGRTDVAIREQNRNKLEQSTNNILFGQVSILSTGINIKRLNNIVFLFSGKSFSRVLQAIGRTLRLHNEKDYAQLVDVSFNFKYSHKHLLERLKIYRDSYNKKPDNIIKIEI